MHGVSQCVIAANVCMHSHRTVIWSRAYTLPLLIFYGFFTSRAEIEQSNLEHCPKQKYIFQIAHKTVPVGRTIIV